MRTRVSETFVLAFKDRLRGVRYRVRRQASGGPVAGATDVLFSQFQAAATALLPRDEVALYAYPFPQPLSAYFAPDRRDPDALTPKIYAALKAALRRLGSDVALISEHAVQAACAGVRAREAGAIAQALDAGAPPGERYDACIRVCAGLAVALAQAMPVREAVEALDARGRTCALAPNAYCAFTVGLAMALCSRADAAGQDPSALEEAADLAVQARFAELAAMLNARDPAAALAQEFRDLLRFLP